MCLSRISLSQYWSDVYSLHSNLNSLQFYSYKCFVTKFVPMHSDNLQEEDEIRLAVAEEVCTDLFIFLSLSRPFFIYYYQCFSRFSFFFFDV